MKKLIFLGALALLAAGCGKYSESPHSDQPELVTFSDYFQAGFEGHDTRFDYSIAYPEGKFTPTKVNQGFELKENSNGNIHRVLFGYNGGLGATSSAEFWDAHQYCATCKASSNVISIAGAEDMKSYSNSTDEWAVYRAGEDYVVIHLKKPDAEAIETFKTFGVRTTQIVTQ